MANELAGCFADPELWRAASHKQLWIGLLLPFGQLLGRLWHSTTAPSGMLLAVDAEAPRLVARSIYYKTLNGGPFCHDVFAVELPGPDSKAVVTCWRDKHSADTFEGQAQLAPAAVAATGSAKSWTTAGTPAAVEESRIRPSGICPCSSSSSSSSSVVANLSTGFKLCCPGRSDLGSRCSAGVGSRLVLPPGFDSDVQLNRAGVRQLRVKERYRGRAQIAYAEFDRPQVIAAELVLFDSPDCVGLLWKRPMDSFSLFSRASQLPRVPQA
ncbi:hypothetical protein OEZ86_006668 [Tetradesmus obliquus]|nr:hypothetical protein OEZ86_006668 [Tetradesmus obliquus]